MSQHMWVATPCPQPAAGAPALTALEAVTPTCPFHCAAYARHLQEKGATPWVLGVQVDGALVTGCLGALSGLPVDRRLSIHALPPLTSPAMAEAFWSGLSAFVRAQRVGRLQLDTFASPQHVEVPPMVGEIARRPRREFHLILDDGLFRGMSQNHKRNIKKARRAGVEIRVRADRAACEAHGALMEASMARRRSRGERVPGQMSGEAAWSLVQLGLARLHEAVHDGVVVSSLCVVWRGEGAYYKSAGTTPEGMKLGAAQLLMHDTALSLRAEGVRVFSLGGVSEGEAQAEGLARFKRGFRGVEIPQVSVTAEPRLHRAKAAARKLRRAARAARQDPREALAKMVLVDPMVVFSASPGSIPPPDLPEGVEVRALTDDELVAFGDHREPSLRRQRARFERLGFNDAYGLFVEGALAHVAWLVSAAHDAGQPRRTLALRAGEAEITHCVTLPAFRGRGLYPMMIRWLCAEAARAGVHRVLMTTRHTNAPSQRGIEKAGLARRRVGVLSMSMPWLSPRARAELRGFRALGVREP